MASGSSALGPESRDAAAAAAAARRSTLAGLAPSRQG